MPLSICPDLLPGLSHPDGDHRTERHAIESRLDGEIKPELPREDRRPARGPGQPAIPSAVSRPRSYLESERWSRTASRQCELQRIGVADRLRSDRDDLSPAGDRPRRRASREPRHSTVASEMATSANADARRALAGRRIDAGSTDVSISFAVALDDDAHRIAANSRARCPTRTTTRRARPQLRRCDRRLPARVLRRRPGTTEAM